jgi:hypothetical protein
MLRTDRPHVDALLMKGQGDTCRDARYCDIASALSFIAYLAKRHGVVQPQHLEAILDDIRADGREPERSYRFALFLLRREAARAS